MDGNERVGQMITCLYQPFSIIHSRVIPISKWTPRVGRLNVVEGTLYPVLIIKDDMDKPIDKSGCSLVVRIPRCGCDDLGLNPSSNS